MYQKVNVDTYKRKKKDKKNCLTRDTGKKESLANPLME
jgi:hypothetical protein